MTSDSDAAVDRRLDAREIDGEPFGAITDALDELADGETLRLINHFEPVPLYTVIEQRGLDHEATQIDEDEWHIDITKQA